MTQEKLREYVLALAWLWVCLVPIPFGTFVSDNGILRFFGYAFFFLSSLVWPLWLRHRQQERQGQTCYAPSSMLLYGSFVGYLTMATILDICMQQPFWQNFYSRAAAFFLWLLVTVTVQQGLAWGFAFWRDHCRRYWFSPYIDPILYALPIPMALVNLFFVPHFDDSNIEGPLIGVIFLISILYLVLLVFGIGSFATYFYPTKERYPQFSDRLVQLLRVVVICAVWTALNLPSSPCLQFVLADTPWLQNNLLAMGIPFLAESLAIVFAVACGQLVVLAGRLVGK